MKRFGILLAVLLSVCRLASAQGSLDAEKVYLWSGGSSRVNVSTGSGAPSGQTNGSLYVDYGSTPVEMYIKVGGSWEKLPRITAANSWTASNAFTAGLTGTTGSFSSTLHAGGNLDVATSKFLVAAATGNTDIAGYAGVPTYVSQTTGWRVDSGGTADFRGLFVDELRAKSFIVNLQQALAGGQIITKSVAVLNGDVSVPGVGAPVSQLVRLPATTTAEVTTSSAHGFSSGDTVWVTGASPSAYNGNFTITVTGSTTFTYPIGSAPTSPATGTITAQGSVVLDVEDLPGSPGIGVFALFDMVVLRSLSRSSMGGITIGDAVGQVVSGPTVLTGHQQWLWTRNQTSGQSGSLARATTIAARSVVLDYGRSGDGYIESTAIDGTAAGNAITRSGSTATLTSTIAHGFKTNDVIHISGADQSQYNGDFTITVTGTTTFTYTVSGTPTTPATGTILTNETNGTNAPYTQTVTWIDAPTVYNRTVQTRSGNLRGITGTAEFGFFAGDFANKHYVRFSGSNAEIAGIPLTLYDGSTATIKLDQSVPSFALGSALPTYGSGTGIWMGKDSGVYKFRVGNPSGNKVDWDDTNLTIVSQNITMNSAGVVVTDDPASFSVAHGYAMSSATIAGSEYGMFGYTSSPIRRLNLLNHTTATTTTGQTVIGSQSDTRVATILFYAGGSASGCVAPCSGVGISATDDIALAASTLSLTGALTLTGGAQMGAPTGGNKGNGTINVAADIYKNNTAYTNPDYVFEHWATGRVVQFAANPGAARYTGLMSLDDLRDYVQAHYRFPQIPAAGTGMFERGDIALELIEQAHLYIFQLEERIKALEQAAKGGGQ